MTGPARSTLAAFARLCLAEADHGAMMRTRDHGLGLPVVEWTPDGELAGGIVDRADRAEYLRGLGNAADRATWLHLRARTHEEIEELLRLRGMPELAAYVLRVIAPGNPNTRGWCEAKADDMDVEIIGTCKAFNEAPPERVAAALRWIADRLGQARTHILGRSHAKGLTHLAIDSAPSV